MPSCAGCKNLRRIGTHRLEDGEFPPALEHEEGAEDRHADRRNQTGADRLDLLEPVEVQRSEAPERARLPGEGLNRELLVERGV